MMDRFEDHPNLTSWAVLAVGMLVVLAWSAREVALSGTQWLWLAVATVLLAGLCAWIISWEADEIDVGDEVAEVDGSDEDDRDADVDEANDGDTDPGDPEVAPDA